MKLKKIISVLVLSLVLFSCKDVSENILPPAVVIPPPAQITGVTIVAYSEKLLVSWNAVAESDIDYYTVTVTPATLNPPVFVSANSRWITGLTNDVAYSITITATNNSGKISTASGAVSATPKDGSADVTSIQALIAAANYANAITAIDAALASTTQIPTAAVVSQLYSERGTANTMLGGGSKSSANTVQALVDFKLSTEDAAYAGRAVLGNLLDDYDAGIEGADHLLSNSTYANATTGWSYFDVVINGAWAAWWKEDYVKCATFMDEIDDIKNHTGLGGDELYDDLLRTAATN